MPGGLNSGPRTCSLGPHPHSYLHPSSSLLAKPHIAWRFRNNNNDHRHQHSSYYWVHCIHSLIQYLQPKSTVIIEPHFAEEELTSARSLCQQAEGLVFTPAGSRVPTLSHNTMPFLKVGGPQRQIAPLSGVTPTALGSKSSLNLL